MPTGTPAAGLRCSRYRPDVTRDEQAATCLSCGAALAPQVRFCPQCGTPAGEEPAHEESSRTGLVIGLASFSIVVLLGAGVYLLGEGDPPPPSSSRRTVVAPTPRPSTSALPTPSGSSPSAQPSPTGVPRAARQISGLLRRSPGQQDGVDAAVADLATCSTEPEVALLVFEHAATARRELLREAEVLRPGRLSGGALLQEGLVQVWTARVAADDTYGYWARDQLAGCEEDPDDPDLQRARELTAQAQQAATEFARAWSSVAPDYDLPAVTAAQL